MQSSEKNGNFIFSRYDEKYEALHSTHTYVWVAANLSTYVIVHTRVTLLLLL